MYCTHSLGMNICETMYIRKAWANGVAYHGLIGTWKGPNFRGKQDQLPTSFFMSICRWGSCDNILSRYKGDDNDSMNTLYNVGLKILVFVLKVARTLSLINSKSKLGKLIDGQDNLLSKIRSEVSLDGKPIFWIHASSLGEYGVARPIIKQLIALNKYKIVLTFFSPTGVDALSDRHAGIDHMFYLPVDTAENAKAFIDIVHPKKAVFIISEFWINYLTVLKAEQIPTYLISGHITRKAPMFSRIYGQMFREALTAFTHFFVLDEISQKNLNELNFANVTISGDPLFDNVLAIANTEYHDQIVEHFTAKGKTFIAGSISDQKDLDLVAGLANRHRDVPFIIVPHEISEEIINRIKYNLRGYALAYSECDVNTDFTDTQVLIIDFLGALAYIYRYGHWAYIGGGFTPYLHSIIESTVYGLPSSFGPMIHRKITPQQMIEMGISSIVRNDKEMERWFSPLKNDETTVSAISEKAKAYTLSNAGATATIMEMLALI